MGRKKRFMRAERKKHNNDEEEAKSNVDLDIDYDGSKYDSSNAIVLESRKSEPKVAKVELKKKKKLSKKQLKKLQCVVQRRQKKASRGKILEEYSKHQISSEELAAMTSISAIQTRGLKRFGENDKKRKHQNDERDTVEEISQLSSSEDRGNSDSSDEEVTHKAANNNEKNSISEIFTMTAVKEKVVKVPEVAVKNNDEQDVETIYVPVKRDPKIEEWRKTLPVFSEEQSIMEAIRYNDVVVICGETGSGKTTQLPQFLYEAGYAKNKMICVTEPRRVAAMAMSQRVGHEMNLSSKVVSYHIRYEKNVTNETKIKFVTDGVLLREVQEDFLLSTYSVIVIDEAHERSVFSDILVGLLSRIVPLRSKKNNPLKLVIMSATLRVDDFVGNRKLFKEVPPVINVDSRQFPVTTKFTKHTPDNYMDAAFEKVCHIHRTQGPGGVLIFVTGRNQVNVLCKKLHAKYPSEQHRKLNDSKSMKKSVLKKSKKINVTKNKSILNIDADRFEDEETGKWHRDSDSESDVSVGDEDWIEGDEIISCKEPLYCLPLFSQLPKHRQTAVFNGAPPGHRLVVVATNVAETSLTIPGIRYVIDTGKVKTKVYDKTTGISAFIVTWSSKASAEQRAGRAGRTCPGICYRLYSSAVFNHEFPAFNDPEIILKPVDDLVLQMKSLNITNVVNFPFPTSPSIETLEASEKRLILMGALEEVKTSITPDGKRATKLTSLGKAMSCFPVSPRYSKMLAMTSTNLIPHVIAIISGLTVQEIFLNSVMNENQSVPKKWNDIKTKWTGTGNEHLLGDIMIILKAIGASEYMSAKVDFHNKIGLRHKAMIEVHKLRRQLLGQVCNVFGCDMDQFPTKMSPPSDTDAISLRQLCLAAFFDQVARRIPNESANKKLKHSYQSIQVEKPVFLDHSSILKDDCPEYVVYQEIHESDTKMLMRTVAAIEPAWLPLFAKNLCNLSDPLDEPPPYYDGDEDSLMCHVTGTFGPYCWPIPETSIPFPTDDDLHIKWFARLLLEGQIHPFFLKYKSKLLTPPSLIVKPWAKLQSRATGITCRLLRDRITSLASLDKKWKTESTYMLTEYLDWLPQISHDEVKKQWPPKHTKEV